MERLRLNNKTLKYIEITALFVLSLALAKWMNNEYNENTNLDIFWGPLASPISQELFDFPLAPE